MKIKAYSRLRKNKYKNIEVRYDNKKFQSKKERNRYIELKRLEKLGVIKNLKTQVPFLLIDTIRVNGKTYRKIYYYADFTYIENNELIVEDVKSKITKKDKVYRLKIRLLLDRYKEIKFREEI